jgi:16S rRNA (guanine1207-N2)-methyltransferase
MEGSSMAAADALADDGVLSAEACLEFSGETAVRLRGGVAVLPWRDRFLAAVAAGLAVQPSSDGLPAGAFAQCVVHLQKGRAATMADLAAAWELLPQGGRLLLCGDNDLGIASFAKRIGEELGQPGEVAANRGHGRIVRFVRDGHAGPPAPAGTSVPLLPGSDEAAGAELRVAPGVFSADGLDDGTALLLSCLPLMPPPERIIDLGCGAGHLAIAGLVRWPRSSAELADGDHRAVLCAPANLERLGLE